MAARGSLIDPFEGFVLAGGASTRMGRDKAMLDVGGRPLVAASVDALRAARRVRVVGGERAEQDLRAEWIPDDAPGEGPLAGLLTAMNVCELSTLVVLPCDLPDITERSVAAMLEAIGDGDAVVPVIDGRPQWAASAWRLHSRSGLAAAYDEGERRLGRAVAALRVVYLLDRPEPYRDVDTPDDLAAVVAVPRGSARQPQGQE